MTSGTLVVVGPTASGKSALAVEVALALGCAGRRAEIVNADSMLVYRGMDVGTAKPSPAERRGIPHHLVDVMGVTETASVAAFQQLARSAIAGCRERGVLPILVGGSALYVRAIVDDFTFPPTDVRVRSRLEQELVRVGAARLHARLASVAPAAAAEILPGNGRRIVRALEAVELTGTFRATLPAWEYLLDDVLQVGLALERELLDARIATRVHEMWAAGFVDEVRRLAEDGLAEGVTASRALGYHQVLEALAGKISEQEAMERTIAATRRFARKQLGWFRRDPRIEWLPAGDPANVEHVVAMVEKRWPASAERARVVPQ